MPPRVWMAPPSMRRLGGAQGRVDPMPGSGTGEQIELPPGVIPGLKGSHFDWNAVAPGNGSHLLVRLHTEHR